MNILEDVKGVLSKKRFLHSLGTAKMAKKLAGKYGYDEEKCKKEIENLTAMNLQSIDIVAKNVYMPEVQ